MIGNNKMIVDGFDTSNLFIIRKVNRGFTGRYKNKTDLMRLTNKSLAERTIVVDVTLISNAGLNDLKVVLNKSSTVRFVFEDDKDWYWDGTLDISKLNSSYVGADISLEILVPDGIKHAVNPKGPYTATQGTDGRVSVTVVNNGSVSVPITMTAKMNAENGYIGMYTDYGVTEIGNKEEDDDEDYVQATTLINTDDPLSIFTRYTGANIENSAVSNAGTASTRTVNGRKHMYLSNAGANNGGWHGASYVYNFPEDGVGNIGSNNVYAYFNAPFWAGLMGQVGQMQVHFATADNEFICGFHLSKNDTKGNTANYYMRYRDSATTIKTFRSGSFQTNHLDSYNPHNLPRAHSDMRKRGADITFYWFGAYPKITVPYLATKKVAKMYLNLYTLGSYPMMSYFDFRGIILNNDSATYNRDVKNRYQSGMTVKMTGADSKVYVNGLPRLSEKVDGSNLFTIPPGETTIYFQCSDWCASPPTYKIEFQEANL